LAWYEREGDTLVGEVDLSSIPLVNLRRWFKVRGSNRMIDSYPVGPAQAEKLRIALGRPIYLDRYSYFVECSEAITRATSNARSDLKQKLAFRNGGNRRKAAG